MAPTIRNAVQQLATNNDNKVSLTLASHPKKNDSETNKIIRKYFFYFILS